ncbi:MAG: purine-nucleoside phosphorylase [Elusimicrobia bacterium]|nr:purine-nucleoside phosphorylase [Elusimicrobiota bacterium]
MQKHLRKKLFPKDFTPEIGIILGSGMGQSFSGLKIIAQIPYAAIPGFVVPTTPGHPGKLLLGTLAEKKVAIFLGRIHYYEGFPMEKVVQTVKLAGDLGIKTLILTAAVGAINKSYRMGQLVVIKDHINAMGTNPLIGMRSLVDGDQFVDMTDCYSKQLQKIALKIARGLRMRIASGVYCAVSGPSYETKSEIRAYQVLGADVMGMSMVPEVIAARFLGLEVLGLALVTNMCAGISKEKCSHEEVLKTGKQFQIPLTQIIEQIVRSI